MAMMTSGTNPAYALNDTALKRHFPNLKPGENFRYTSPQTDDYNCVSWATEITTQWIQFIHDAQGNYDLNVRMYATYFENLGFEIVSSFDIEPGFVKIAIYAGDNQDFKHVARQLPTGKWTSKIGDWEDIEHDTLEAIAGGSYGNPVFVLGKFDK